MAIIFHCEHCGKKIEAAESAGGKWGKCPACHNKLYVPSSHSGEELKLAPIDVTAEEREKQLMAETHKLTQDILQEREVPEGTPETIGPIETAGPVLEMSERELTKYIIMYLKLMADSELYEAHRIVGLITPHSEQAVNILDKIALSEMPEPELADISQLALSGSIRALRDEIG
jgi:phage FluMu protein Com